MNFEVLKKSHLKRNIIIGVILIAIISAVVLNFTRAKYRVTQSIPLVNGTINEDCKLSTVSGDIEMLNTSLNGKTNIKTVSGDAILKGNNFDQNKIAMSTISGELQINKQVVASLSSKLQDMFKNMF